MYESKQPYYYGTGRRKSSVARVRVYPGSGNVTINGRDINDYFGLETLKLIVRQPLVLTETAEKFDIVCILDNIDVFVAQFAYDAMNTATLHAHTSTYWVDAVVIAFYGNLGAFAWDACNLLDGDKTVVDFGHFHFEQALQENW